LTLPQDVKGILFNIFCLTFLSLKLCDVGILTASGFWLMALSSYKCAEMMMIAAATKRLHMRITNLQLWF
jgi:hypothetical protein